MCSQHPLTVPRGVQPEGKQSWKTATASGKFERGNEWMTGVSNPLCPYQHATPCLVLTYRIMLSASEWMPVVLNPHGPTSVLGRVRY